MITNAEIASYYDSYSSQQEKTAFNERHLMLIGLLSHDRIEKEASILEIGCGIGIFSYLFLQKHSDVQFTGLDISPKSIEKAAQLCQAFKNANFKSGDIATFAPGVTYDHIFMFDTLEHIPAEKHPQVFETLARLMHPNSHLYLNVPFHPFHEISIRTEPELLQIIEVPVSAGNIAVHAENNGLYVHHLESFGVWFDLEYQWIELRKKPGAIPRMEKKKKNLLSRFTHKIRQVLNIP